MAGNAKPLLIDDRQSASKFHRFANVGELSLRSIAQYIGQHFRIVAIGSGTAGIASDAGLRFIRAMQCRLHKTNSGPLLHPVTIHNFGLYLCEIVYYPVCTEGCRVDSTRSIASPAARSLASVTRL